MTHQGSLYIYWGKTMTIKKLNTFFALACGIAFLPSAGLVLAADTPGMAAAKAEAQINPTKNNMVGGTVTFEKEKDGILVTAKLTGLTPGKHGFHVHAVGDCSAPDGTSAGAHFDPMSMKHGSPTSPERHEGDLGNILAGTDGVATLSWKDKMLSLSGPTSVVGKSVIVHAAADDFTTQPTGNAGARVACGVIKSAGM